MRKSALWPVVTCLGLFSSWASAQNNVVVPPNCVRVVVLSGWESRPTERGYKSNTVEVRNTFVQTVQVKFTYRGEGAITRPPVELRVDSRMRVELSRTPTSVSPADLQARTTVECS